jgi:hypothetical protein
MLEPAAPRKVMHSPIRRRTQPAPDVIHQLARETQRPVEEVRTVYERQLERLESRATVKGYVEILARRKTREALRRS